ncbi:insulinase family protein [Candidatus Saccharibacteria bacterium CPR2]|nr:insulinase family protein [Candidatus Saccharibacteria bacterium CPR2]
MKHTVNELKLVNGTRGLLINVPDASVMSFDFQFRAGYYLVPKVKWEAPHIMEHMMFGANARYEKARTFQAEFEKNGAYANASTSTYSVHYLAECADFEWDRILELIGLALGTPKFVEHEFKSEYGNVKDELAGYLTNYFRELNLKLQKQMGLLIETDQERLQLMSSVKPLDIRSHYKTTHFSDNMRFVIAGQVKKRENEIKKVVEDSFKLKRGERKELPFETPVCLEKVFYIPNKTVDSIHFILEIMTPKRLGIEQRDALHLLNTMLTATLHSLILGEARERGLVYNMGSNYSLANNFSSWWFGGKVMKQNSEALFNIMIKELQKVLRGEIKNSDIEAAKQYSLGRFQRGTQTVGALAGSYSGEYFFNETIEDYFKIPERIKSVTKASIISVAREIFAQNIWGLGILGNCGQTHVEKLHKEISVLWK